MSCTLKVSTLTTSTFPAAIEEPTFRVCTMFSKDPVLPPTSRVYTRRVWMLGLFSFCSMLCGIMFSLYTSMSNLNMCYYGVGQEAIAWTSMMFMVVYIVLVIPVSYLISRIDLRWTVVCTAFFNTVASAMEFATLSSGGFPFVMVTAFFSSMSNVFVLGIPPFLAARWFPSHELSRACAVGVFGNQFGIALGFVIPNYMITSDCAQKDFISHGKENVAYLLTAANLTTLILILLTFQNAPPLPPSPAQAKKREDSPQPYTVIVLTMIKNFQFILICVVYGLMVGTYFALATFLNNLILKYFPNKEVEVGWMGSLLILTGLVGSVIAGYILDHTHRFKETSVTVCVASFFSLVFFTSVLPLQILWVQFLAIGILGFFLTSFLSIGFEYAIEITFPGSESVCACLLNSSSQIFGMALTEMVSGVLPTHGAIVSNIALVGTLLVCCIVITISHSVYCQSDIESVENTKKLAIYPEYNVSSTPTTDVLDKINDSNTIENDDELHYEDDNEEHWTTDDLYVSESSTIINKTDNDAKKHSSDSSFQKYDPLNFKPTDQISDRLPHESIQTTPEGGFQQGYTEDRNKSSQPDLTNTQSKVVISHALNPDIYNSFNTNQEKGSLSKRVDGDLDHKESHKRVGTFGKHAPSFLNTHNIDPNSEITTNSKFSNQGGSSISELEGKVNSGIRNLFYSPFANSNADRNFISTVDSIDDKGHLESNSGSPKYSRTLDEDDDSDPYDSDRQKHPEVTRKVTVVKEKTMRSISRTEEQETVNMPEKPEERFSGGESIILKTQTNGNNILDHPKVGTEEQSIVLVEGSHIPGKNYGTDNDLFGYHSGFYGENYDSPQNGKIKDIEKSGENGYSSHRIQHNNHGNGVSTQFFSSSPSTNVKGTQSGINIPGHNFESVGKVFPTNIQFKPEDESNSNPGHGSFHLIPINGNDQTQTKCRHNHKHTVDTDAEIQHEDIDTNQLYIDANTGQLIKFVTEDETEHRFQDPSDNEVNKLIKDSETWPPKKSFNDNFNPGSYLKENLNQHSGQNILQNWNNKGKIKTRSTQPRTELSNSDVSSNNIFEKLKNEHNYQEKGIGNQFDIPSKGIDLSSDTDLSTFSDSQFSKNNFKGVTNGKNDDVDNGILYAENQNNYGNGQYGQKLKIGGSDFSLQNVKGEGINLKSFPGSDNLQDAYRKNDKPFQLPAGLLNPPSNVEFKNNNFESKLSGGGFSGNNHNRQTSYPKPKGNTYRDNKDTYKNVYFEFPTKSGNRNSNKAQWKGNSGSDFYLPSGNKKGSEYFGGENEGHNLNDCPETHNTLKGQNGENAWSQGNNKGSGIDIRKHPNYMISLQNLYGFQSKGFPMGNVLDTTKKQSFPQLHSQGNSKGDQLNFKTNSFPQALGPKRSKSPKNFNGLNKQNFGYEFQNNGKFDGLSFEQPKQSGKYNLHGSQQPLIHNFQQNTPNFGNSLHGMNQHQGPDEYILINLNDNSPGHTESEIQSYYQQYENNFKGEQVDLSHENGPNGHSFANTNLKNNFQSPDIRFVVEGGSPLGKLATTGFHMARSVLPLMTNTKPKSIHGNINFGLQFSKRKGPSSNI